MTLSELGAKHGTDKGSTHSYLDIYEELFVQWKDTPVNIAEVGTANGCSLRMWLDWFMTVRVIGIDENADAIRDLTNQTVFSDRWKVFQCEQTDDHRLNDIFGGREYAFMIDDAGHDPKKQMLTFLLLWRHVQLGGFYVIEDIPNDYWADYWDSVPGAKVFRNHKAGREDDILVIIRKAL